ncbi:hypothetical protein MMG85_09655 [Pseudoxanthomonas sp. LH2527]|uniref:hypothetical protein n=1 Tax=Pseudoxanthomonas sp. LH2527 TaxID=2923249 RepID=UPI001F1401D4|nr:hypothetical protein [Pseudoxanthomonas sp. LH2527]MCH6483828.1 hypothetical protein [Pseudoxanthomonas sp. LH2527]
MSLLLASAKTPDAQLHLERASDYLGKATVYLRKTGDADLSAEFVKSAVFEVEKAGKLEPTLSKKYPTADVATDMRELESMLLEASTSSDKPEGTSSRIWSIVFLALFSLCVIAFLVAYFMLLAKHWDSKPGAVTNHMRARLEPMIAFFAFVLGIALVLIPELDQATAMWGAGVSGSGVGYWFKAVSSPAGTA